MAEYLEPEGGARGQLGKKVAAIGGGLIGRSWTALFLAAGASVAVHDPDPATRGRVEETVAQSWPVLTALGLTTDAAPTGELTFHTDPRAAVDGADFIQESIPERVGLKHELYAVIEPALGADTITATSASGLTLTELQGGWRDPSRFVLGHPFNPPHLIPLVEVMGNERTAAGVVDAARAFYESVGKVTIEVHREVPGHVANRLQAALWREAIHLVLEGVATLEDVDIAVRSGPGQRWAVMGPTMLFHLGGDEGGIAAFCERYTDSFNRWWDDLGDPRLDTEVTRRLVEGMTASAAGRSVGELSALRDRMLTDVVAATHPQSPGSPRPRRPSSPVTASSSTVT